EDPREDVEDRVYAVAAGVVVGLLEAGGGPRGGLHGCGGVGSGKAGGHTCRGAGAVAAGPPPRVGPPPRPPALGGPATPAPPPRHRREVRQPRLDWPKPSSFAL